MGKIINFPVLAGAYLEPNLTKNRLLTHACEVDESGRAIRVLCNKVKLDSICPYKSEATAEPTCPSCLRKVKKLVQR